MSLKSAALLVGINRYKSARLRGCVPDVYAMAKLLTEQFGVDSQHLDTLTDHEATRAGIIKGLQWLALQGADLAYFVYSGHGTRVPELDADEARQESGVGFDQAIVPIDYARRGIIIDDELADTYTMFSSHTKLIVHLDSCFSATTERGLLDPIADFYRRHTRQRVPRVLPPHLLPADVIEAARTRKATNRGALPRRDIILISGCRDLETSADAYLGRQYQGAMTYYMRQAIRACGQGASYLDVIEDAGRLLAINGFSQVPQVTGPRGWLQNPIYT